MAVAGVSGDGRWTASGLLEVPPAKGITYRAFVDPSGGSRDAFTLAVAHRTDTEVVADALRAWAPPFNPSGVVAEAAAFLKTYKIRTVTGDRYAGEWPREQFRQHEIPYLLAEKPKTDLYLELLASVNGRKVQLLDDPELQTRTAVARTPPRIIREGPRRPPLLWT